MRTTKEPTLTAHWIADHDPLPIVGWGNGGGGFHPCSEYVETYWLTVVGPSSIFALRQLTDRLEDRPSGVLVSLEDLALSLGLGPSTRRHAPVVRTLDRLVAFGLARIEWDAYAVRSSIPVLTAGQLRRLPPYLAKRHDELTRIAATPLLAGS